MFRYIQIILCCFCLFLTQGAFGNLLKDRLQSSKSGDYIVVEQNKITTILSVNSITSERLILEEISIPSSVASRIKSWKTWVKKSAPGHSSWVMYEVDLKTDQIVECFSFSKSAWLKLSQQDYWLACLFHIPLTKVDPSERKKIGPQPMHGEKDYRQIWNPPMMFHAKKRPIKSVAYRGLWPDDGTDLARKRFEIYFDENHLSAFPCWIQVSNPHLTINVRIIDAGKKLKSIYQTLPKRPPEFVRKTQKIASGYRLHVSSPEYFKELFLYVCDLSDPQRRITRVAFTSKQNKEDIVIDVPISTLHGNLHSSHVYSWVISPKEAPSIHVESKDSFCWQDSDSNTISK